MNAHSRISIHGYDPGHPWFYVLGGPVLPLRMIRAQVQNSGYKGYRNEIEKAARKPEPKRSALLTEIHAQVLQELKRDISGYRSAARTLSLYRKRTDLPEKPQCEGVHVAISLKHNHIFNDFAHLIQIEQLTTLQPSLFDSLPN